MELLEALTDKKMCVLKRLACLVFFVVLFSFLLIGCTETASIINTPTPMPSQPLVVTTAPRPQSTPMITAASFVEYNSSYPTPSIIGNIGSNIENGGLSVYSDKRIYYVNEGLWRMTRDGVNEQQLSPMQYLAFLNDVNEYIYYVSAHDLYVYRVLKDGSSPEEQLPVYGAYDLLVLGDYMYYRSAGGDQNDYCIFRCDLNGNNIENLGFKSSSICPDGVYIYFSNLEDDGKLYRFNTITSELVKLRSDKAIQINIIDDMIYYIDANDGYKVVRIERTGSGRNVIIDEACTSLNHERSKLLYTSTSDNFLKSFEIDTEEIENLFELKDIRSINVADKWIFFESYTEQGLDANLYRYNIKTKTMYPKLPKIEYAYIDHIDMSDLIAWVDFVEYYTGDEAAKQYALDNEISLEKAQGEIQNCDETYYIHNPKERLVDLSLDEWAPTTLVAGCNGNGELDLYTSTIEGLNEVLQSSEGADKRLLFKLSVIDDKIVGVEEIYCPKDTTEKG